MKRVSKNIIYMYVYNETHLNYFNSYHRQFFPSFPIVVRLVISPRSLPTVINCTIGTDHKCGRILVALWLPYSPET